MVFPALIEVIQISSAADTDEEQIKNNGRVLYVELLFFLPLAILGGGGAGVDGEGEFKKRGVETFNHGSVLAFSPEFPWIWQRAESPSPNTGSRSSSSSEIKGRNKPQNPSHRCISKLVHLRLVLGYFTRAQWGSPR